MATDTDRSKGTGVAVLAVLLAACAGSVDVFPFFGSKNTLRTGTTHRAQAAERLRPSVKPCQMWPGVPTPMDLKSRLSLAGSRLGTSSCRTTGRCARR